MEVNVKEDFFARWQDFRDSFASAGNTGKLDRAKRSIDTGDVAPINSRPYRLLPEKRAVIRDAITKTLEKGVIEPSDGPWSSPIILVEKKSVNIDTAPTIVN